MNSLNHIVMDEILDYLNQKKNLKIYLDKIIINRNISNNNKDNKKRKLNKKKK